MQDKTIDNNQLIENWLNTNINNIPKINIKDITIVLDMAARNSGLIRIDPYSKEKDLIAEYNQGLEDVEHMKINPITQKMDLYYMLHPENIKDITQKVSSPKDIMEHAIRMASSYSERSSKMMSSRDSYVLGALGDFKKDLNKNKKSKYSLTSFDLETISGTDKYGHERLFGIYDYAFSTITSTGKIEEHTSLIGITKDDEMYKVLDKVKAKLINGEELDNGYEKVAYEYVSRLGASFGDEIKFDSKLNGKYFSPGLVEEGFQTTENFIKGFEGLTKIGEHQRQLYGSMGGYALLAKDIANAAKNPYNIMTGHNIANFDIPVIMNLAKTNAGFKQALKEAGVDIEEAFSNHIDTLELAKTYTSGSYRNLLRKLAPNGIESINPDGGSMQLETIVRALGYKFGTHHSGLNDAKEVLALLGFYIPENGKMINGTNAFLNGAIKNLNAQAKSQKNINKSKFDYDSTMYLSSKKAGGIFNDIREDYAFSYMENADSIYTSSGVKIKKVGDKTVTKAQKKFYPAIIKGKVGYTFDPSSLFVVDNKEFISELGKDNKGIAGAERLIGFKLNQLASKGEEHLLKASSPITVFVAENRFNDFFSEHFDVLKIGDKITPRGKQYSKNSYIKDVDGHDQYSGNDPVEILKLNNHYSRITDENISRSLRTNSLNKGLVLRELADTASIHLYDMHTAFYDLIKTGDATKFNAIMGGVKLTRDLEKRTKQFFDIDNKNLLDSSAWRKSWTIDGEFVPGWFDNSIQSMDNINPNSIGAEILRKSNGASIDLNNIVKELQTDISRIKPEINIPKLFGLTTQIKQDNGIRRIYSERFLRKNNVATGRVFENTYIDLDLKDSNGKATLNKIIRSLGYNNPDKLSESKKLNIINSFLEFMPLDNSYNSGISVFEEKREQILNLIDNKKLKARDKALMLLDIINDSDKDILLPRTYEQVNINSSIFTQDKNNLLPNIDPSEIDRRINMSLQQNIAMNRDEIIQKYILNGQDVGEIVKNRNTTLNKYKGLSNKKLFQRKALFKEQLESHLKYGKTIIEKLESAGASISFSNGRIYALNNGIKIDLTEFIPKFSSTSGATYTNLGNNSYATGFTGIFKDGNWNTRAIVDSSRRMFLGGEDNSIDQAIADTIARGGNAVETVLSRLKNTNKIIREEENVKSSIKKDYRLNASISVDYALKSAKARESIIQYLQNNSYVNDENVQTFLKEVVNDKVKGKDLEFINTKMRNSFYKILGKNILPSSSKLNKTTFHFGAGLKDTTMQTMRLSLAETLYGDAPFENAAAGWGYMEESAIRIAKNKRNKNIFYDGPEVKTADDYITDNVNGVRTESKIRVVGREFSGADKNAILDKAAEAYSVEDIKLLREKLNTYEGGAYLSGKILDSTNYIEGIQIVDLSNKETINSDKLANSKVQMYIDPKDGSIKFKYGEGDIIGKNNPIAEFFSDYEGRSSKDANRASIAREKYYLKNTNIALTEKQLQATVTEMLQKSKDSVGNALELNEKNVKKILDTYFDKKLEVSPLRLQAAQKVKDMFGEKHKSIIGLRSVRDGIKTYKKMYKDDDEKMKGLKTFETYLHLVSEEVGEDVSAEILTQETFEKISKGEFGVHYKPAIDFVTENSDFVETLIEERYRVDDLVKEIFGVDYLSLSASDMVKHKNVNKELSITYAMLAEKFVDDNTSEKDARKKALNLLVQYNAIDKDSFTLSKNGDLILNTEKKDSYLDLVQLEKLRDDQGIDITSGNYNGYIELISDTTETKSDAAIDNRWLGRATNQIYDKKVLRSVADNMKAAGLGKEFWDTFGNVIDENFNIKLFEDGKSIEGKSVWESSKEFREYYSPAFQKGETLFNPDDPKNAGIRKEIYEKALANGAPQVSEEFVDDIVHYKKLKAAEELSTLYKDGDSQGIIYNKEKQKSNFVERNIDTIDDEAYDFRKRKGDFQKSDNVWKQDSIINLNDKSLGLDDEFFEKYDISDKMFLVGHDPFVREASTAEYKDRQERYVKNKKYFEEKIRKLSSIKNLDKEGQAKLEEYRSNREYYAKKINEHELRKGENIPLKEYQNKASLVFSTYNKLKDLNSQLNISTDEAEKKNLQQQIVKTKEALGKHIKAYEEYLPKYTNNMKAESALGRRIKNRIGEGGSSVVNIFNTKEWGGPNDAPRVGEAFGELTYKGQKISDLSRKGQHVSFTVASTADLDKYGFTDDYFRSIDMSKEAWLKKARTEGVASLIARYPMDYAGSVTATQLYFSDDIAKGTVITDELTAALLKADVDGDKVVTYALGVRGFLDSEAIDTLSASILTRSEENEYRSTFDRESYDIFKEKADRLQKIHDQSMYMSIFDRNMTKKYHEVGSEYMRLTNEEKKKKFDKTREKLLAASVNNKIFRNIEEFNGTPEQRYQYQNDWSSARDLIKTYTGNKNNSEIQDYEIFTKGNDAIKNMVEAGIDQASINTVEQGMRAYQELNSSVIAAILKTTRSSAGEMDTPFDTIDMLHTLFKTNSFKTNQSVNLTQLEVNALNFLHESAKEGFLTPKKGSGNVLDHEWDVLSSKVNEDLNIMLRGNVDQNVIIEANQRLVDNLTSYGKDVMDRNNIDSIMQKYGIENADDEVKFRQIIQEGVNTIQKMFDNLAYRQRSQGMYGLRRELSVHMLDAFTHGTLDVDSSESFRNMFKEQMNQVDNAMREIQENLESSKQAAFSDVTQNVNTITGVQNTRRMNHSDVIDIAESIKRFGRTDLAKNALYLAAGLLFTGFVGGNPSVPSGGEARPISENNNSIQPIPQNQSASSLNSMRQGPNQGYIINISGTSRDDNTYIGNAISEAVRQNYQNSQVNINLKTQEQTDISYDQVYDYMSQSLF